MAKWSARDIPSQQGRVAVVTGANSGLGLVTTRELARAGARVIMGCRDATRGAAARSRVVEQVPDAAVDVRRLDLASLASIREFADSLHADVPQLDLLVNNAGVMAIPRQMTDDGFEMQLGTNHLGHFALTGLLLPSMIHRPGSRVVTVSSSAHKPGRIDFDDLMGERSYRKWSAYYQSKLANLLFAYELQRRLDAADLATISVAAHPGYSATNLQQVGPRMEGSRIGGLLMSLGNRVIAQSDEMERSRSSTPPPPPTSTAVSTSAPMASQSHAAIPSGSSRRSRRRTPTSPAGYGSFPRSPPASATT